MKPETEEAVQAAKGLLQDLVFVATLVRTLADSFGSARDLYKRLKRKSSPINSDDEDEKFHISMLSRGRRDSGFGSSKHKGRDDNESELIFTASVQIRAEYERGYRKLGESFARGDATTQIQLQSQVIQLQQVIISIHEDLLVSSYIAPSSTHSHLVRLIQTTRTARAASIAALNMQLKRMVPPPPPSPRLPDPPCSPPGAFPEPEDTWFTTKPFKPRRRNVDSSSSSNSSEEKEIKIQPFPYPVAKPKPDDKEIKIQPFPNPFGKGRPEWDTEPSPKPAPKPEPEVKPRFPTRSKTLLFCPYAKELQDDPRLPLSDAYKSCNDGKCPFCRTYLSILPGKVWEIIVDNCLESKYLRHKREYRVFRLKNRFIVKSHRENGGFACVLCARFRRYDMLCADIGSLIDHLWREHSGDELAWDCDIVER